MTPDQQRIAIAEACGWTLLECEREDFFYPGGWQTFKTKKWFLNPSGELSTLFGGLNENELPDYLNDLNAMHEAEKQLQPYQWNKYEYYLGVAANQQNVLSPSVEERARRTTIGATASQRAEAFLRTLNLWKE